MATRRSFLFTLSALGALLGEQGSAFASELRLLKNGAGSVSGSLDADSQSPDGLLAGGTFSPAQIATLGALAAAIVPEDGTPSARDLGAGAHVAARLALLPEDEIDLVRSGLDEVARVAQQQFGRPMDSLDPGSLQMFAGLVAANRELLPLWLAVRALTVLHYYAQPEVRDDMGMPRPSIDRGGFPDPANVPCLI